MFHTFEHRLIRGAYLNMLDLLISPPSPAIRPPGSPGMSQRGHLHELRQLADVRGTCCHSARPLNRSRRNEIEFYRGCFERKEMEFLKC